jgi:hypothetical protein
MSSLQKALDKAVQLAEIASDWHLDEVEIDGEMANIYDLRDEFKKAFAMLSERADGMLLREALAEYAHEAWSGWMKYMFSKTMRESITGGEIIPAWAVERWQRQLSTPYADLPEEEKESDRAEADKMLAIMGRTTLTARPTE